MLGNGLPNRQDGFCFHRAPGFHTREQMSTDHFILFYRFFCFSIKYVPILDILVFGPLKTFFFFFFLPCHSLLLEFREMVNPERGNQGLSFVSPGKNSKTFLGTDWSRTTRPLLLRGNGTYWYKANFVFKK